MRLCRYRLAAASRPRIGLLDGDRVIDLERAGGPASLEAALQLPMAGLMESLQQALAGASSAHPADGVTFLAPIDSQEVWAAGVTYRRSRDARMEESTQKDVYDQVYEADRPELFFKATPNRVSGPGEPIAIRGDSTWDVPEPEVALLLNAQGELIGGTIGNDVSSRSIEGANPLYLPQAKVYAQSAALGPTVVTVDELGDLGNLAIAVEIRRGGAVLFQDATSTAMLHRTFADLAAYLFRCNAFPAGVFLMTGTGIVPPSELTLEHGDEVAIAIDRIGSLVNPVVRLPA